jgi:hypothetical protein
VPQAILLIMATPSCGFKVSCSQIPRRAFAGIRTHDPLSACASAYVYPIDSDWPMRDHSDSQPLLPPTRGPEPITYSRISQHLARKYIDIFRNFIDRVTDSRVIDTPRVSFGNQNADLYLLCVPVVFVRYRTTGLRVYIAISLHSSTVQCTVHAMHGNGNK